MFRLIVLLNLIILSNALLAREKVSFITEDSLRVTADLYIKDYELPFILLFHQSDYSRGEYNEIAKKLLNLNYNCLAVDLRSGNKINYVRNETAERAEKQNIPHSFLDAGKDIEAAISYIQKKSKRPIILFGSSYSASLCLLAAKNNDRVKAVIAFSPGEYFRPNLTVRDELAGLTKPVFIAATDMEFDYINKMLETIPESYKTIYQASGGRGVHGAKALWESNQSNNEYWLALTQFFRHLKTQ